MYKYIQKYQCQPSELIDAELCLQRFAIWGQILSFIAERKSWLDPKNRFPLFHSLIFFLLSTFPFFSSSYFFISACVFVIRGGGCFIVLAWPAWLRWLAPLAPPLPLRPLRSVPRPVRCGWGIKPSALCTFARQAGPRCPTPTTLWTTALPSKTAGPPNPPTLSVSSHVSAPFAPPSANPHIQPASHSVTPQLNHGLHFLQKNSKESASNLFFSCQCLKSALIRNKQVKEKRFTCEDGLSIVDYDTLIGLFPNSVLPHDKNFDLSMTRFSPTDQN